MVNLALDGLEGEDSKIIDDDEDLYASLRIPTEQRLSCPAFKHTDPLRRRRRY